MRLELRNLPIGTRIGLALALPIAGLLFLAAWLSVDRHRIADDTHEVRKMAELAPAVGALIHELQIERGLAAGVAGARKAGPGKGSRSFSERLSDQLANSDRRRLELDQALARYRLALNGNRSEDRLTPRIAAVQERLVAIEGIRATIATGAPATSTVTERYSETIEELLAIAEEMLLVAGHPQLTRAIATYIHLLHVKEQVGQERALGAAGFASGRFDAAMHARMIERMAQQRLHIKEFHFFASAEQSDFYYRTLHGLNEAEIGRMRRIALKSRETGSTDNIDAADWFDSMTQKIDLLRTIEEKLLDDLLAIAQSLEATTTGFAWRITLLAILLLAITLALAGGLARGILTPLKRMTRAMEKLAANDEKTVIDGTGYNDEIAALARAAVVFRENLVKVAHAEEQMKVAQELRIAATAFESLHGMMVTDAQGIILRVNKAFTEMTGWSAEEAVGQSPAILKSGRHDGAFYADMWKQLAVTGAWSGEIWDRRKNGEIYPKWQTISAVRGPDGHISHYVAAFSDISERKEAERRIHDLAFYDPLTRLPNRRLLLDRLQQALAASARAHRHGALLFIDLDNFKSLNDTLGHDMGDQLLVEVAARLQACLRGSDTAARLGGDEFVVMLEDLGEQGAEAAAEAKTVGMKVLECLNHDYDLAGKPHHSTPSIGITLFLGQATGIDELLKQADLAMYEAKAAGRNAMRFFDPEMEAVVTARSELEAGLRAALQENRFILHYQPQVDGNGQVIGAEALLRWQHPGRGLVMPGEFVPVAEETGLILPIGLWVLTTACARLAEWQAHASTAELSLAINVSPRQFRHPDFVKQVLTVVESSGVDPHGLKFELTESLLLDDVENTVIKMTALKEHGIRFSLDDFGTGYSSLAYLKRLPLDQLKIDRSFVRDVLTDPNDAVIARTIVALGQSLGLAVIAEGVETRAQRDFLIDNNCHAFQGYLFGRPGPEISPGVIPFQEPMP